MPVQKPNLLLVFSDQHRACDLGCYGNRQVMSPALDAFADQAARVTNCVSSSPVCVPIRGTMLTGLHPWHHGALSNDLPIRTDVQSVAHVLARAGYRTGYVGKWHLGGVPRDRAIPQEERLGFEGWKVANCTHAYMNSYYDDEQNRRFPYEGYEPVGQTGHAVDFIRRGGQRGGERGVGLTPGRAGDVAPWALFLSWGPPHAPYREVPREYLDRYDPASVTLRPNVPEQILDRVGKHLSRAELRALLAGYYAHITALDDQFARLLAVLDETGQASNTVVVYTSDHGDMLGSQGVTKKQLPWDESALVPLMVRWPGTVQPSVVEEPMGLVDLPVSLVGLLGLSFDGPIDGADLSRLFTEPGATAPAEVLMCNLIPAHQAVWRGDTRGWFGLRSRERTYAVWDDGEPFCLYENENDPYQQRNLCEDHRAAAACHDLTERVQARLAAAGTILRPWQQMVIHDGYQELWNKSQAYFKRPLLTGPESSA
jgi:arylsulfatase A-like enzyme